MGRAKPGFHPPFCPNPCCDFHRRSTGWRFKRMGFYERRMPPHRIQRFLCFHCRRSFSSQTFDPTYYLKRPELLGPLLSGSLGCSAYRQMARELGVGPSTVARQVARLGRHCLLFQERYRPAGPLSEPLVIDGLESFEFSQYWPMHLNTAVGATTHFVYAFTDSELRRKGRMRPAQRKRRAELEACYGRPNPRAIENGIAELLELVAREPTALRVHSDEHPAYPRAFRRLAPLDITHQVTSSRRARNPQNPLFVVNVLDLLLRHSGANHKRETLAFSKRRQSAVERMAIFQVWRNFMKSVSERKRDSTPAQRLGIAPRKLGVGDVLRDRLFPSRLRLPERLRAYYWREIETRQLPKNALHRLRYAF